MVRWRCVVYVLVLVVWPRAGGAISTTEEQALGKQFALAARAQLPFIDDLEVNRYVDGIGQKIVASLGDQPFTYHFAVVRDPRINAFAVPGGYIYVHAGLLAQASNDDELAGVLGHEIAHVNGHHLVRQQQVTKPLDYLALLGMLASVIHPAIGAGAMAVTTAAHLKYSRDFEQEADYVGARYMQQAGYDPRGMLDFFKKMLDAQRASPSSAPPYLLSHPLTEARLTNLEAVLRTNQWDTGPRRPTSPELERVQLLTRLRSEPAQDVVAVYRRQADAQPQNARARDLLGLAYLETGGFDAARDTLQSAQQLGFKSVDRDLGRTYLRLRQLEKARELLSRAAEIDPDDPLGHLALGETYDALHQSAAAMREYERAFALAPTLEQAHYGFAILAGRAGREGEGFYHLGVAFKLRGEFDKAVSQFEKAEPLLPAGSPQAKDARATIAELKEFRH
jgi:predicted Zn-dependent protease